MINVGLKTHDGKYKEVTAQEISDFKVLVSRCLTPETSAILLDPEYGLAAAENRAQTSGLLLAYEKRATMLRHQDPIVLMFGRLSV